MIRSSQIFAVRRNERRATANKGLLPPSSLIVAAEVTRCQRTINENWTARDGAPIRYSVKKPFSSKLRHRAFRAGKLPTPSADGPSKDKPKDPKRRRHYLSKYREWLRPYFRVLVFLFVLALAGAALDMVWPLAIKHIIDGILLNGPKSPQKLSALGIFGLLLIGLLLLKQAIDSTRSYRT